MPAKDIFHNAIRSALIKDGWQITDDPLFIKASTRISLYINIGGERAIGAEKEQYTRLRPSFSKKPSFRIFMFLHPPECQAPG